MFRTMWYLQEYVNVYLQIHNKGRSQFNVIRIIMEHSQS